MRRKRLQHVADTLCHMFCGWRLLFTMPRLEELGSGVVEIDVLAETATFNDVPTGGMSIVAELAEWMRGDLAANSIPIEALHDVTLRAQLSLQPIHEKDRTTSGQYFRRGELLRQDQYVACDIRCESVVATDEAKYVGRYFDREEWPRGWKAR
jgi:hypothetical protein